MAKILIPYTIVPPNLYVHRDADRQIKNIINDMGRPGYVLVSRQMGKTNLLLNAKRELETPEDTFVYIDLSNPFNSARSCFENIIDTAIETNLDKYPNVHKEITKRRRELIDTPPHKQHSNELRLLLKAIKGKLVIILDEIDALTKTSYSDQIFAQIRSIYFSRVNYPELERLTYILSGVIEPTEIIKDPKISPFNIGQKIFLNDFSKIEFEEFLSNSRLNLSPTIYNSIYFWTSGNPRMTWDICSEVENAVKKGAIINPKLIDNIVTDMYLTAYDKPPIDNIRELVKQDRDIRNAIIEIGYNKGNEVSGKIKSKLYLAGIINYHENNIQLKNEIIKQSLDINWIRTLEEEDKGLIKIATDLYQKQQYIECLETYERYLKDNDFEENERPYMYFNVGMAAYKSSQFEKAIKYFEETSFDVEGESKWYYRVCNYIGLSYYYLNNFKISLKHFKIVIESDKRDETYAMALMNFCSVSLKSSVSHQDEAIKIFRDIISETGLSKEKIKKSFFDDLKSIAYFNLAQILQTRGEASEIKFYLIQALSLARDVNKPSMILSLLSIVRDDAEKYKLLSELVNLIVEKNVNPSNIDPENPIAFTYSQFNQIVIQVYLDYRDSLFKLLQTKLNLLGNYTLAQHILALASFSFNELADKNLGAKLLHELYANFENSEYSFDTKSKYRALTLIAHSIDTSKTLRYHLEYANFFRKFSPEIVTYSDFVLFSDLLYTLYRQGKYKEVLFHSNSINSAKGRVKEQDLINYLAIYNFELNSFFSLRNRKKAIDKAKEIIEFSSNNLLKGENANLLGETGFDIILQNATTLVDSSSRIEPIKIEKSYGRNELVKVRYKDGTLVETKFKKIEKDLNEGKCLILT